MRARSRRAQGFAPRRLHKIKQQDQKVNKATCAPDQNFNNPVFAPDPKVHSSARGLSNISLCSLGSGKRKTLFRGKSKGPSRLQSEAGVNFYAGQGWAFWRIITGVRPRCTHGQRSIRRSHKRIVHCQGWAFWRIMVATAGPSGESFTYT